jgi:hypothetical protein
MRWAFGADAILRSECGWMGLSGPCRTSPRPNASALVWGYAAVVASTQACVPVSHTARSNVRYTIGRRRTGTQAHRPVCLCACVPT